MNKPINDNCCSCSCSIKDRYPSFQVTISKLNIENIEQQYVRININNGEVFAVVRKGIVGLIHSNGSTYKMWFDYSDVDIDLTGSVKILFFERVVL